jgi:DNA-directed RNA polymerase specialized sigma24 family protein
MRFYGGYTLAQTSKLLGMPISTIASREAAILRKIRIRLHKKGF